MAQEASLPPPPGGVPGPGGGPPDGPLRDPTPLTVAGAHEDAEQAPSTALDRLLPVAVLTPAQAAHVAAEVLRTASTIGRDRRGDVRLTPPVVSPGGQVQTSAATDTDGVDVDDVLSALVANARRLPAHPRPHQVALLHRLEEVAGSSHEPGARALMLRAALDDAVGPDSSAPLTQELASLVAALAQISHTGTPEAPRRARPSSVSSAPAPAVRHEVTRGRPATGVRPIPPAVRRDLAGRRTRRPGARTTALLLLGLLVLVGGYLALNRPGSGTGSGDQAAGPQASGPSTKQHQQPAAHPRPLVPVFAPPKAGRVTGVALQRSGPCRPGGSCAVQVTAHLAPSTVSQTIAWRVGVVRACTRQVTWSSPATVTAQPGWTRVYAGSFVRIPSGHPVALVAVTGSPARAQSPPIRLTPTTSRC
jgi:hypothetical protein